MPSPNKIAPTIVYESVRERFLEEGTPAEVVFGWAEQTKRGELPLRVVFAPGDGDNLGNLLAPRGPGGIDRALSTLGELVTVDVHAYDGAQKDSEIAQYTIARKLLDAVIRAIHLAYNPRAQVVKINWVKASAVRPFGRSVRMVLAINSSVTDTPFMSDPLDAWVTNAKLDGTAELDVTEAADAQESY